MKWTNTDFECKFFNYNAYSYAFCNNRPTDPFCIPSWYHEFYTKGWLYPKQDLKSVENFKTKSINPESKLFFDSGSTFPRFKLGLTDSKRCIKVPKADYIVVSGENNFKITTEEYVVLEDSSGIYIIPYKDFNIYFNNNLQRFVNSMVGYHNFESNVRIIYQGKLQSYEKDSLYLAKYINGEYTVPYITDNDLDKICCNMCPDPTYEEFVSIIDMLNSDDASIVQLGVKMIAGYNVEKYKLSFKLILCSRRNWFNWSKNLVACKQLVETLGINSYNIYDDFAGGCARAQLKDETYTAEDLAIAKKLSSKLIREWLQHYADAYFFSRDYKWLPDERTIEIK